MLSAGAGLFWKLNHCAGHKTRNTKKGKNTARRKQYCTTHDCAHFAEVAKVGKSEHEAYNFPKFTKQG